MFERNVYDYYGLYCESRFAMGDYEGFDTAYDSYLLLPKEQCASGENDMVAFISYMRHQLHDQSVLELVKTRNQQLVGLIDGQEVYLFKLPSGRDAENVRINTSYERGEHLGAIHYHGKQIPINQKSYEYFGKWHNLWQTRLQQLEDWYLQLLHERPQSEVDEAFLFTFPYFMGLTENAIQYAVDARIDERSSAYEQGTICHRRFTERTWLVPSERGNILKCPTDFIYDHRCRDIAEWLRSKRSSFADEQREIFSFLEGYEQFEPLTPYGWRLAYARLLCPVHYFEGIENYYRAQVQEKKHEYGQAFFALIKEEKQNEDFLRHFQEQIKLPRTEQKAPSVDWI